MLARESGVLRGRVNMTTSRLRLVWRGSAERAASLVDAIERLGYRLVPFDAASLAAARDDTDRALLRALAVAGFAAGNVMLLSIGIWAGEAGGLLDDMGPATRDLLHWVSALIAMPAIAYAGMPFFASAVAALRRMRTNMDVPISLGVLLVTGMSLAQTMQGGAHTYFDSAITLLFFLLIGRVLDHRARGQARATAEQLLTLRAADAAVLRPDGSTERRGQDAIVAGDRLLVGLGERIGVDGIVERGSSTLDGSLVTGESLPVAAAPGTQVFAGTLNLGEALIVRATATGNATLLAECVRLIEAAEARRSRFVVLADRVARRYAPAVHITALATFLWWYVAAGAPLERGVADRERGADHHLSLRGGARRAGGAGDRHRTAVPRRRPAEVADRAGASRRGGYDCIRQDRHADRAGDVADPGAGPRSGGVAGRRIAGRGQPPSAGAFAAGGVGAGRGRRGRGGASGAGHSGGRYPLGSRAFASACDGDAGGPELWLSRPGHQPVCFRFAETLRADAVATMQRLRGLGLAVHVLSGDHPAAVARVAAALGIASWQAGRSPVQKVAAIEALAASGRKVMMVGDGLNDSPSLAAASVSASPASAADISQTVADVVFQGQLLAPVAAVLETARRARAVMRQNLLLSIGYNALMVPLAVAGFVTPWLAAAAMSSSSLLVLANSFRVRGRPA